MYEQQMREVAANLGSRRRQPPIRMPNQHAQQMHPNTGMFDSANRKMEDLECRLCHKVNFSLSYLRNDSGN